MKKIMTATLLTVLAVPAFAQTATDMRTDIDAARNANQERRIEQGTASGQLNTREQARLNRQESRIDRRETRAGADGKVTAKEQRGIDREQDRVSKHIYDQKHDAQTAQTAQ